MIRVAAKKITLAALCFLSTSSFALNEMFSFYDSPQGLMMGNATMADSKWYTALFQNPAGLAQAYRRDTRRHISTTPVAIDWMANTAVFGEIASKRTMNWGRVLGDMQNSPDQYFYSRTNIMPSITHRNFGFAILYTSEFAGQSDGANVDLRAGNDLAMVTGVASNFFGNLLKVGVTGKAIIRNQISGTFAHTTLTDSAAVAANSAEGMGFGFDAGILLTAPLMWLPTIGITVRDVLGTQFSHSSILNSTNNGQAPAAIPQSVHAGIMLSPILAKGIRSNFTADLKYIDRVDLPLSKRLHFGVEIITDKRLYFWAGLNQMLPCFGMGLRTVGGDLELGSYAQDIGAGTVSQSDRRFVFRYTIGW